MGLLKKAVKAVVKTVTAPITTAANIAQAVVGTTAKVTQATAQTTINAISAISNIAGSLSVNNSSSTSSTNTGTVTAVNNDINVYIPAQDITFEGHLFKPNTRLYVFFDGRDVSSYIEPDGGSTGNPLVSDSSGYIKGTFHLPNNSSIKFTQGKKELKFTDSSKDDNMDTTYAVVYFTYSGVSDEKGTSQNVSGTQPTESRADPMVQSFYVLDEGGVYLKSINLYFLTKDSKFPVSFQIREVIEDSVSNEYISNSNYILNPADINTSTDGSVPTTITFDSPVFLQEGKEYGIYMITNAPGTCTLATCVYGETNSTNQLSTRDPRIGGIMKNLGSSAWLKDTSRGIKFSLNKCAFDTTTKYTLALDNEDLPTKILANNSLSTTVTTNVITVTDKDHSFNVGDFVTISGLPEGTLYGGISSDYINGIHRITEVTNSTYKFDNVMIDNSETLIPQQATSSVIFGFNVTTDVSYQYNTLFLNINDILLSNTGVDYTVKGLSGRSLDGTETPNIFDSNFTEITNQADYNTARVKKVNSKYNEIHLNPGSAKSLQVNIDFSTSNENISPVVDVVNTSAVLIENVINNQDDGELTDVNPKGIARYITRDVSLSSQSNGIQVRYSGNVQGNANIHVYYKTLPLTSTGTLDDQNWVEMTPDQEVPKASNDTTFNDYVYTIYHLPLFKAFKTKVLMTSPDSSKPPLLKQYRAIAFQSVDDE